MEAKQMIRDFLENLFAQKKDVRPFADDTSLILGGRLDSIDTVELLLFLETTFGAKFSNDGFRREQLDTLNAIVAIVNG
jgi:acyl carrier protein